MTAYVTDCVERSLRATTIGLSSSPERCDCILAALELAELPALIRGDAPVVVLSSGEPDPARCTEAVRLGAQDCLIASQLSDGRLEHVVRAAVHRHATSAAQLHERDAAEALLAAMVAASHDPIWSVELGGVVSSWNSGAEALLGYAAEEIVGRNVRMLAAPDRIGEMDAIGRRIADGVVTGPTITERIAKDGSVKHVSITVSPILDDQRQPTGACVIARDLAPLRTAERELVDSEERYRRIVETAGEGIAILDADATLTFVNGRFARMLDYHREALVGTPGFDLIHPDDVADARRRWHSEHDPSTAEVRYCRSDGSVLWAQVSRTRQSGAADRSWLVMVTDITARKLAEQDLAEREQRFRAVFDNAYDAILVVDDDRRFVDVNPAACRILARTREELLDMTIDEVSDPAADRGAHAAWSRFRDGTVETGTTTVARPDGEVREIEYAATPNISPRCHLAIVRDVTDRNAAAANGLALEHRLNQAERLETVGQLAGGVAHDFNNILSIIVNYAELARTARGDGSVEQDLAEIDAAAARGRALTRQLLIVSQRDTVRPEVFDIVGLVRSVQRLLDRVIGDRIRIETILPDEPVVVSADRGRIDQLVMNLALNARDAMPAGGTLSIAVSRRPPAAATAVGDVALTVSDDGVGMNDDVAGRAFEPFFTTKSAGQGVGLGLAAAHGIVTDAGGHISLTSRPGEGTTVTVVLPGTAEAPTVEDSGAGPRVLDGAGRHVLIVEDDAKLLDATRRMLDRHGYLTSTASNAEIALAEVDATGVDIVLTDLVMPGMSGVSLAQTLRLEHPEIPVICMSGYSARRGMLPEDVRLLEKPFAPQELLAAIAQAGGARG